MVFEIVPYLSPEDIEQKATSVLTEHQCESKIPIPIETILEVGCGIDIVPLPGLQAGYDIDSCISHDLQTVYVDEYIYLNRQPRYRFSLAHELGHRILHADLFRAVEFGNTEEWKELIHQISPRQYSYLETQANRFAGCLLMPYSRLQEEFKQSCQVASEQGIELSSMWDTAKGYIATDLARTFNVSSTAMEIRMSDVELKPS